jgi:cytidylate kinase
VKYVSRTDATLGDVSSQRETDAGSPTSKKERTMSVITVSREVGSEGTHIAEKAAQVLGYHYVDKTTMEKILQEYGLAADFREEYDSSPSFWTRFTERGELRAIMMDLLPKVTLALAHHGNVLMLGRGCFGTLAGFADVLNVRVQAPLPTRVKRTMVRHDFADLETAEAYVKETDEVRTAFVKACYDLELDNASLFDLVIDTSKVPVDMATRWLIEAVGALASLDSGEEHTTASIEPDFVLAHLVEGVLGCDIAHG